MNGLVILGSGLEIQAWIVLLAGALGGVAAGLMGIGGGLVVNPLLIACGVPPRVATACMSVAIVSNAAGASAFNLQRLEVDWKTGLLMGSGGVLGGQLGTILIGAAGRPAALDRLILICFTVLLLLVVWRMLRAGTPRDDRRPHGLLTRLPFRYHSPACPVPVSPLLPMAAAVLVGGVSALLGVGGGVFFVPLLLMLFRGNIRELVPVSQLAVLLVMTSVSTGHILHTGHLDPLLALLLVLSGGLGTAVGSRLRRRATGRLVSRLFALVLAGGALKMFMELLNRGAAEVPVVESVAASGARAPTGAADSLYHTVFDWIRTDDLHLWLGTVGLALVLGPALAWVQHAVYERLRRP